MLEHRSMLELLTCTSILVYAFPTPCYLSVGSDFTVEGFEAVLEYLYTTAVQGSTEGEYNLMQMHAVRQAADFFGLPNLGNAVIRWASACGIDVECDTWTLCEVAEYY